MSLQVSYLNIDIDKLNKVLEEDINAALSSHNGFCTLDHVEGGDTPKIYLSFFGGCDGCPSSFSTTLLQIQELLREEFALPSLMVINTETT
jgi:Fe-S cluster biogenesis protein NfuA